MKESFRKKLVRSRLRWAGLGWRDWEVKNRQREQMPRNSRGIVGEEDRDCDGRTS